MSLYLVKFTFTKPKLGQYEKLVHIVTFTLLQLLQHNIQLGAASQFSILSSHWFIYGCRQHFIVINLSQTVVAYRQLLNAVRAVAGSRRHLLFVNERAHATSIVSDLAKSIGEAYAIGRWVGGTITNFRKIWLMHHYKLKHIDNRDLTKFKFVLKSSLGGMHLLKSLPTLIFFNSVMHSYSATQEAHAMAVAAGGVTDTDALPDALLYPIPGNDDSFVSLYFLNKLIAKTVILGKIHAMTTTYNNFCEKRADSIWHSVRKRLRRATRRFGFLFRLRRREFWKLEKKERADYNSNFNRFQRLYNANRKFIPYNRPKPGGNIRRRSYHRRARNSKTDYYKFRRNNNRGFNNKKRNSKLWEKRRVTKLLKIRGRTRIAGRYLARIKKRYWMLFNTNFKDIGKNKLSLKFYFKKVLKYIPKRFLKLYRGTLILRRIMEGGITKSLSWVLSSLYLVRCVYLWEQVWTFQVTLEAFLSLMKRLSFWSVYFYYFPAVHYANRALYILRRALTIHLFKRTFSPFREFYNKTYGELEEGCSSDWLDSRDEQICALSEEIMDWYYVVVKRYDTLDFAFDIYHDFEAATHKPFKKFIRRTLRPARRAIKNLTLSSKFIKRLFYDESPYALYTWWFEESWYRSVTRRLLIWPGSADNDFYVLNLRGFRSVAVRKYVFFSVISRRLAKKYILNRKLVRFLKIRRARYFALLKILFYVTRNTQKKLS